MKKDYDWFITLSAIAGVIAITALLFILYAFAIAGIAAGLLWIIDFIFGTTICTLNTIAIITIIVLIVKLFISKKG